MPRNLQLVLALLAMIAVTLVLALPAVNLLPTALRASGMARLVMAELRAMTLLMLVELPFCCLVSARGSAPALSSPDLLDLTCSRLC